MRILVTGAGGFVGRSLCPVLEKRDHDIIRVLRSTVDDVFPLVKDRELYEGNISSTTDWSGKLNRIDIIVHLAAKVHVMHAESGSTLATFREVNVEGSTRLVAGGGGAGGGRVEEEEEEEWRQGNSF